MLRNHIKWWVLLALATIAGIYLIPFDTTFAFKECLDRTTAMEMASDFLKKNQADLNVYQSIVVTQQIDNMIMNYIHKRLGHKELEKIANSDLMPNNRWQIDYLQNLTRDQKQTGYSIWLSTHGQVIGYQRQLPDTLTLPSIIEGRALALARYFISNQTSVDLTNFALKESQQNRQLNRTDYIFVWEKPANFVDGKYRLTCRVQGNQIGGYEYLFELPENIQTFFREQSTRNTILFFVQFILLMFIFMYALILFLHKYHEGEVSLSLGRNLFLIIFGLALIGSINEFPVIGRNISLGNLSFKNNQILIFLYEILIRNSFWAILLLTGWAVGEAYARKYWPEKLNSIDSMLNKRFFTSSLGYSLLRGGAIGFAFAAGILGMMAIVTNKIPGVYPRSLSAGENFQHFVPVIAIIIKAIISAVLSEVIIRFFIISIVYHRWHKKWLAILISSVCWVAVFMMLSYYPQLTSYPLMFSGILLFGLFMAWLFFKYDLLTLIAASAAAQIVFLSIPLIAATSDWHRVSILILVIVLLIPIALIIVSFIRKDQFQYSYSGMPGHILRISERERMEKELEIARIVQTGLLPKSNPVLTGFDISAACKPAKEVGGDYYDFVYLSPTKTGIVIGDVSGKGVPAAIYMTLTKGILQSHVDETVTPKIVLGKVNRLLYKNIEKNSFVSLFYAILDSEKSTLTFARAGHNPGIMINSEGDQSQFLTTAGIALGLEQGTVFDQQLQEQSIRIKPGNTLVFYTDGFTEAMNSRLEEFGEKRFLQTISENRHLSADHLIKALLEQVRNFTGSEPQHDDMTVLVIKAH